MIVTIRGNEDEDLESVANEMLSFFNIDLQFSAEVRNGKQITRMPHAQSKGHASIVITTRPGVE